MKRTHICYALLLLALLQCASFATRAAFPIPAAVSSPYVLQQTEAAQGLKSLSIPRGTTIATPSLRGYTYPGERRRSRVLAAFLCLLSINLPFFPWHRLYLGYYKQSLMVFLGSLLALAAIIFGWLASYGVPAGIGEWLLGGLIAAGFIYLFGQSIWYIVDFFRIIFGDLKPKDGKYYRSN